MNKVFCVISHTHWDREWYMPFEKFRIKLVDLMDNVIDIMETYPGYIFYLDAQTIILEDYLEIRPYKRLILERFISEGRLLVGPWYVQNDFYLTSGEATIRNLMIGSASAEAMGKCTWVGYTPDQFGLISQLPQILNGFGIDSCIFGRGYDFYEKTEEGLSVKRRNSEFIWQCCDGSSVLAIQMPFWYNNAQRFSEDIEKSMKLVDMIEKNFEGIALTPYLLLMNGVDHLEAQENLLPILGKINHRLGGEKSIRQYSMEAYVDDVKKYMDQNAVQLTTYEGELRNGHDRQLLQGTLSSRVYLKTANVKAQNLLECNLEPLYSFIHMLGGDGLYPSDFMTYLWKQLLKNHPHDNICGCSRDEVHRHMEDKYERISQLGEELLSRGMDFISAHIDRSELSNSDYLITVLNTVETTRSGLVDLEVQLPACENVKNFDILDQGGRKVPYRIAGKENKCKGIYSPINLPGAMDVDSYRIQLFIEHMDGLSYETFIVRPKDEGTLKAEITEARELPYAQMENEYMKVSIQNSGRIDLEYKDTGRLYSDILKLEEDEDCGNSYNYFKTKAVRACTTKNLRPQIKCIANTTFEQSCILSYDWQLPELFDLETGKRSEKLTANRVDMKLTLKKDCKWLDISIDADNRSKNHRVRALVNTGFTADYTNASIPFDIVKRDKKDVLRGINSNGTQPDSGFVNVDGEKEGIAVLTEGLYEYEHLADSKGMLAITLLRANGRITGQSLDEKLSEDWNVPENQCLRRIKVNFALYPHTGNYLEAAVFARTKEYQNPFRCYFQPADLKKFTGGRPAVQDSEIKEIFYREDKFTHVSLPRKIKIAGIKGDNLILSALKKAEKDNRIIVRVHNISEEESELKLDCYKPIKSVFRVNLREEAIEKLEHFQNECRFVVRSKQILTLAIDMEDCKC